MSFKTLYKTAHDIIKLLMAQHLRLADEMDFIAVEINKITGEEWYIMKRLKLSYLLQFLVRDLLESNLYTLNGLARELGIPVEPLTDLFLKRDCDPSCSLAMTILYLHHETFPKLYDLSQEAISSNEND